MLAGVVWWLEIGRYWHGITGMVFSLWLCVIAGHCPRQCYETVADDVTKKEYNWLHIFSALILSYQCQIPLSWLSCLVAAWEWQTSIDWSCLLSICLLSEHWVLPVYIVLLGHRAKWYEEQGTLILLPPPYSKLSQITVVRLIIYDLWEGVTARSIYYLLDFLVHTDFCHYSQSHPCQLIVTNFYLI